MKLNRVLKNSVWIIFCKIIQAILTLFITILSARYLGPSNYGIINYAASVVAFFVPVMQLGFRNTLVQEFVGDSEKSGEILGTSIILNFISSIACMAGVFMFVLVANRNAPSTILVCVLYSLVLPFQALEMVQYWFQYKLISKYQSIVSLAAYFVIAIYKSVLLLTDKSIFWFAIAQALDYAIIAIVLLWFYKKISGQKLSFSLERGKRMFSKSKYYILSNIMVMIFGHTDKVMLQLMVDEVETGFYSAALTCATMTSFIFAAIIDSARPIIFENKKISQKKFEESLSALYTVSIYFALVQSLFITVFAPLIIHIMYGESYYASIRILRVVVWFTTFSNLGAVRNIWILAEDKYKYLWKINVSGALFNVIFNFMLIPHFGAVGAAAASLGTQFFTNVIVGFILKPIRENNRIMMRSMNIVAFLKNFLRKGE